MKTKISETSQVKNKHFTRDSLKWCNRSGPWLTVRGVRGPRILLTCRILKRICLCSEIVLAQFSSRPGQKLNHVMELTLVFLHLQYGPYSIVVKAQYPKRVCSLIHFVRVFGGTRMMFVRTCSCIIKNNLELSAGS